jgi:hypothetical protein
VRVLDLAPPELADGRHRRRRVDELECQDGREHTVGLRGRPHAGQELLDRAENGVLVADEG